MKRGLLVLCCSWWRQYCGESGGFEALLMTRCAGGSLVGGKGGGRGTRFIFGDISNRWEDTSLGLGLPERECWTGCYVG